MPVKLDQKKIYNELAEAIYVFHDKNKDKKSGEEENVSVLVDTCASIYYKHFDLMNKKHILHYVTRMLAHRFVFDILEAGYKQGNPNPAEVAKVDNDEKAKVVDNVEKTT